jgi:hypothetical protein
MSSSSSENDREDLRGSGAAMNDLVRRMAGVLPEESDDTEADETDETDEAGDQAADFDGGARSQSAPPSNSAVMDKRIRRAAQGYPY